MIISTNEVVQSIGYTEEELDNCSLFLVNEEIKRLIREGSARRKLLAVVYSNPEMNDEAVRELIHYANTLSSISRVILLVEKGQKEEYYELFEEVVFVPSVKKVHIIECQAIPAAWAAADKDHTGYLI